MTRLTLAFCLLAGAAGCTGFRPVGPLARALPTDPGQSDPAKNTSPEPIVLAAPQPTPPLNLVDPSDVTATDPYAAAQKLLSEIEGDRKTIPTAPRTAEVSRYKNGVKQN